MADKVLVNGDNHLPSNETSGVNLDDSTSKVVMDMLSDTWGFNLEDLYRISMVFFKEKNGSKALLVGYKDKLRMVALTKQVTQGPYNASTSPAVGLFDVVGNDRRLAWQSLGDMSKEDAMKEFISFLRRNCPLFAPYVQAKFAEKEQQDNKSKELDKEERVSQEEVERLQADASLLQEEERKRQLAQELMIRTALNQSTAIQFKQYAEQQFPSNPAQQEALVRQLQDQHYIQYMQQLYSQQLLQQQTQPNSYSAANPQPPTESPPSVVVANHEQSSTASTGVVDSHINDVSASPVEEHKTDIPSGDLWNGTNSSLTAVPRQLPNGFEKTPDSATETSANHVDDDLDSNDLPPIAAASMWTRKELKEFKDSIKNDTESVIKVGSGEIVTVRVPTHEDGSCLFWEFATDSFDIGFGVYFEWTAEPSNQMSIVTESSEEEEEDQGQTSNGDPEAAINKPEPEVPTEEIVPPFRRECHKEVYCGSHVYPGRGVYLLKFDNSYSLWRGKTLYYRVYYTR